MFWKSESVKSTGIENKKKMETMQERLKDSICLINLEGKKEIIEERNNSRKYRRKKFPTKEMHKPSD